MVDGLELRPGTAVNLGFSTRRYRNGTVILVKNNISINSNIAILRRAVRVLYNNQCQGLYMLRKYNMAMSIVCVVLRHFIDGHTLSQDDGTTTRGANNQSTAYDIKISPCASS